MWKSQLRGNILKEWVYLSLIKMYVHLLNQNFLWHCLQQEEHMVPRTKRWQQKWSQMRHKNVYSRLCRIGGPGPVRRLTLQSGHSKGAIELQGMASTRLF